jgi:hypothetical protein
MKKPLDKILIWLVIYIAVIGAVAVTLLLIDVIIKIF